MENLQKISKGDFGNNKFLDISMKKDNQNKNIWKFIPIYKTTFLIILFLMV